MARNSRAVWLTIFATMAAPAVADEWSDVVDKAKQEGVVVVHGAPGKQYFNAQVTEFNKAYPGIKVQFSGASSATEVPKVMRERQAGLYNWDVWVGGPTSVMQTLIPSGALAPLQPILRPDIIADDKWINGWDFAWMDLGKKFFHSFDGTVNVPMLVNFDVIKPGQLTGVADLLKPEFAGKIVMHDPRINGAGSEAAQTMVRTLGEDGYIALLKNKVVFSQNDQQTAEWVVRGRYPITLGIEEDYLEEFRKQGLGKNVQHPPESWFKIIQLSIAFGSVGLVDQAPHPNAARVYINWLLSKQGGEAWSTIPRNSMRTDVPPATPSLAMIPGHEYMIGQAEKYTEERVSLTRLARKVIDGQ